VLGLGAGGVGDVDMDEEDDEQTSRAGKGEETWLEVAIEIPGMRDDDALPVFLSAMLTEALLADGELKDRLWINRRFHWRLYIDVCVDTIGVSNDHANGKSICRFCCFLSHFHIRYRSCL